MREDIKYKAKQLSGKAKVVFASGLITATSVSSVVLATDNKYAKNASDWVLSGVQSLVIAAAVFFIGMSLLQRKFVKTLIMVALSAIIIAISFNPNILKNIGEYLTGILFG